VFPKLLTLFIIFPLVELYVILEVGSVFGALPTVLLVVLTAVAGAFFTKLEGLRTLRRMQQQIMVGQMPTEELIDSVLICVAGLLLLTPGFLTDAFGFWILIPPTRHVFKCWLRSWFDQYLSRRTTGTIRFGGS
jgi:UPF0716 protein FxsA